VALPKAELHVHLHRAMRPATVVELGAAAGLTVADPRAFIDFAGFQVIHRAARACVT
jgi:adenosine deaminase